MDSHSNSETNDNNRLEKSIERILSTVSSFIEKLDRHDAQDIIRGLVVAVLVEEVTRMTVTKRKMNVSICEEIDIKQLSADWQTLSRHYAGSKYAHAFENGVLQLEKIPHKEAQKIIQEIKYGLEDDLNWAMEMRTVNYNIKLPIAGKLVKGKLNINLHGTRIAIQSLGPRMLRMGVQFILWLAVALGTAHWVDLIFFPDSKLFSDFEGVVKLAQFILLSLTTLVICLLFLSNNNNSKALMKHVPKTTRLVVWIIVAAGWCSFVAWILFGSLVGGVVLEIAEKVLLPFFLVGGSISAWISGRIFRANDKEHGGKLQE